MTRIQDLASLETPGDDDAMLIARARDGVWFKVPWSVIADLAGGGTLTAADITDFSEAVDDRVGSLLSPGNGVAITYDDGANQIVISAVEPYIYQNADYTLTSTTASQRLFNQTANGRFTFAQTGIYKFECQLIIDTMSATSGNALFNLLGAGTATLAGHLFHVIGIDATTPTNAAAQTGSGARATNTTPASMVTAATGTAMLVTIRGIFRCTGLGTMIPSLSLVTANGAVVKAGSHFSLYRIGDVTTYNSTGWD